MQLYITYRDRLGLVSQVVSADGIIFSDGMAHFDTFVKGVDHYISIPVEHIVQIGNNN